MQESENKTVKYGKVVFFNENEKGTFSKISQTILLPFRVALDIYAETPNPASQLVEGDNENEIDNKIETLLKNMDDREWLEENLLPYL